jgi:hypothetical protein
MSNMPTIRPIPVEAVNQFIPMVQKYIEGALTQTDLTFDQIKVYLTTGGWSLLAAFNNEGVVCGAYVLSIVNTPNDRTATIVTAGGMGLASQHCFDQLCAIARHFGATKVQALASESATRLYKRVGLQEKSTLLEMKL